MLLIKYIRSFIRTVAVSAC